MDKEKELQEILRRYLNTELKHMVFSNPRKKGGFLKLSVRPVMLKNQLKFQFEEFTEKQAFHRNLDVNEAVADIMGRLSDEESGYKNGDIEGAAGKVQILVSKKGTVTVKEKKAAGGSAAQPAKMAGDKAGLKSLSAKTQAVNAVLSNNRTKKYLLPEGTPVPFLVDLGVMTKEGRIVNSRYDKFRQINRFLEFIDDILPKLSTEEVNTIIDFGCGKSYLTFAMYYYLREVKGYKVNIIGLDLKKDVIKLCNELAVKFGFDDLKFYCGDIADYEGVSKVDMVVTLHACDTATDYALEKAVNWGAKVILSVPCCQHEVNKQIKNDLLSPVLKYGIIKERMSALITDAVRAEYLESRGYRTQILEFIDMEHTPKNILIRAVYDGRQKSREGVEELLEALNLSPMISKLL